MRNRPETIVAAHYRTGEVLEFEFIGDRIRSRKRVRARPAALFGPGFVDLQCNGYAGVDFNRKETEPVVIAGAFRAMWEQGCTEVLPTIITTSREKAEEFFRDIVVALRDDAEAARSVPGFHLEGPFISPEDGARGAHPLAHTRPVDAKLFQVLQRAAEGAICLVTLAPEVHGAFPFIRQLRKKKILPALGHTLATSATVRAATDAGALMSTHLGNGCPQMLHRHSNAIIAQLSEPRLAASFIADGIHLPEETLRVFWKARGDSQSVLVTDAMAAAGAPPGHYSIGELEVEVGEDRVVRQPGSPNFAGSALTMDVAVTNLVNFTGVSLADAWDAASTRPWALLRKAGAVRGTPRSEVIARWRAGRLEPLAALRGAKVLWTR